MLYRGSAADKLLRPGSFLRLPSLDEKGLAYIQEVTATPDAWYGTKDAIAESLANCSSQAQLDGMAIL